MESYLDVQHLTKSFGEKVLFDDMSFSVSEGQKVGLVARNGTGKSTLLSILHGDEGLSIRQLIYPLFFHLFSPIRPHRTSNNA